MKKSNLFKMSTKTKNFKTAFALVFLFFNLQQTSLWNVQASAISRNRRKIAHNESPETQSTHSGEHLTNGNISIQHDNVTSKSTKLIPQYVALNETELLEVPKKTTLKLLNATTHPINATSGIEASEIVEVIVKTMNTTNAKDEFGITEGNDRVSEKFKIATTEATTTQTTTTTTKTTVIPNTIETTSIKSLKLNRSQVLDFDSSSTETNTTSAGLTDLVTNNFSATQKDLLQKRMDLLLDDTVDMQNVSTSSSFKQAKFLQDNSTNSNQLNLPSSAAVWTLASMKKSPPAIPKNSSALMSNQSATAEAAADPVKEKTLTDWTRIVKMGVDNALNDDENINENANETTESFMENTNTNSTTTNISALYTTPPTPSLLSSSSSTSSYAEINLKTNVETTTIMPAVSIEKEFYTRLLNHTLLTLTPSTIMASTESSLSANDKTDMKAATAPTNTTTTIANDNKEFIEEKSTQQQHALKNKEKEALILSANQTSVNTNILNTNSTLMMMTTTTTMAATTIAPVQMMSNSSSSTPATAIVSGTTTVKNFEVRHNNQATTTSGITEGEKRTEAIEKIKIENTTIAEETISNNNNVVEASNIETTTIKSNELDEKSKIALATNVAESINFALSTTTTQQTPPDIHQKSNKSESETPTTTTETETTLTKEIATTTPTTSVVKSDLNSSAIVSPATTTATTTRATTIKQVESKNIEANETNVSEVLDSLSEQSTTTSVELNENTTKITTAKPAVTTTTTATTKIKSQEEHVTRVTTTNLEETTFINKDFQNITKSTTSTTTTTSTPQISEQKQNSNETAFIENEINLKTSTISELEVNKLKTTTQETPKSAFEMNANNVSINNSSSTTSTESNELSPPTTTIITTTTPAAPVTTSSSSSTSTAKSPTTIATTSTVLSISTTNRDDLYDEISETTTPTIAVTENPKLPAASETTKTTPPSLPSETTAFYELHTTSKTIEEKMIPITKTTTTSIPTHYEESTSTENPFILHANVGGSLHPPALPKSTPDNPETDVNVVIAISVSVIGVVALILLVAFIYLMRKRQKQTTYGQRCRPVSLDAYSLDNVSVMGSMRKRPTHRSKRSYGNAAFQDPALRHNVIQSAADLAEFVKRRTSIFQEFDDVPKVTARAGEIPQGCEDKNRYANVIPLPETRVVLQRRNDDDTTEYINANYVRGPSDAPNYYIACQAPLESTVQDFWRMIWEQQSRVIIQATDLFEEGKERCAEYLPPSVTLDNHTTYGDFQVTLKNREVKDKYAISTILLKNTAALDSDSREITHYWYKWPETGVPTEEAPIIAMLLEARSSLKSYAIEAVNELKEKSNTASSIGSANDDSKLQTNVAAGTSNREINGNVSDKAKNIARHQGPLTIHCSPGTGRTGTIIACDMAIRSLEATKSLDIPQIVYDIRRGRASAVQTKDQYEFIYKVANVYATKITSVSNDN